MAAQVFLNTVFVQGFPGSMSRFELMTLFGGRKGYIEDLHFTSRPGEPKKAFIVYQNYSSVPLALNMNGTRLWDQYELKVEEINSRILCDYVPGENNDISTALKSLQSVLGLVVEEKDEEGALHLMEVRRLNDLVMRAHAIKDETTNALQGYKLAQEKVHVDLTTQHTQTCAQLDTMVERCSRMQEENDALQKRLAEATAQLKATREPNESIHGRLEVCAQREPTLERLGRANDVVTSLDSKRAKDERLEARSNLWRTETSLDEKNARLAEAELPMVEAQRKRQRAEEWLADERQTKKQLLEDMGRSEMENIERVEREVVERKLLEERLNVEIESREKAERELVQANAKLDQVVITDALLAAFLKMENWTIRVMEK